MQLRIDFDTLARLSTDVSLNQKFLVGPVIHAPLIEVLLLQFRQHCVVLTTDIIRMHVLLPN